VLQPYNALSSSFFGYNVRNPLLAGAARARGDLIAVTARSA